VTNFNEEQTNRYPSDSPSDPLGGAHNDKKPEPISTDQLIRNLNNIVVGEMYTKEAADRLQTIELKYRKLIKHQTDRLASQAQKIGKVKEILLNPCVKHIESVPQYVWDAIEELEQDK